MKKNKKRELDRSELSGYLFAHFGASVGIDIVPFLANSEEKSIRERMLKGRSEYVKSKKGNDK